MAKWHGTVGFAECLETRPGVYEDRIVEKCYSGDIIRNAFRNQSADQLNDNIVLANRFSIIADPYANENLPNIRYVEYMGCKWKVSEREALYPRIILSIGGVYTETTS